MKINYLFIAVILVFALPAASLSFGSLTGKTPEELYHQSNVILVGKIENATANPSERVTSYTIQVDKYLKNDLHQQVLYLTSNGCKKCIPQIEDEPVFDIGSKVLLYLNKNQSSYDMSWYSKVLDTDSDVTSIIKVLPPLQQFKFGIAPNDIQCKQDLELIFKTNDDSPACVTPTTAVKLVTLGWAKAQNTGTVITISEGQREGPLLVQKVLPDSVQGLNFREYPIATNKGYPITLHIGDTASNGCTVGLTLVKIDNHTATFLRKENQNRPCPICLSANTVIDTPNGPINVQNLKVGMTIFTQDAYAHKQTATILKTGKTLVSQEHKMIHVVLDDKRELYVSPNHPTADGRLFGELTMGDTLDGSKIKNAELVQYNGTYTYDILPSGQTGFYWANGILAASTLK